MIIRINGNVVTTSLESVAVPLGDQTVVAASDSWSQILGTVWEISDWLCVGVIIFAGATWMFGNRTKAIEQLIGGSAGYIVIRHAMDIQHWLRGL